MASSRRVPKQSRRPRSGVRNGFSLIELMVVLVIMALLAGLASTTLRSHVDVSKLERSFQQLALADAYARQHAREHSDGSVSLQVEENALIVSPGGRRFSMPDGLDLVLLDAGANGDRSVRVNYASSGRSASYAIRVENGGSEHWLVVLGATGQRFSTPDADLVRRLLP